MKLKSILLDILRLVIIGLIIGLFISFYQFLAHEVILWGGYLFNKSTTTCFVIAFLVTLTYFINLMLINKIIPGYSGSGIPAFEGYQAGWYKINPIKMLIMIFINSLSAFFAGFPLGGEGPSISISGSIGMIINKIFKKEDKIAVAASTGAGFSTAFLAPIAGFIYLIEENKEIFGYKLLIKGLVIIAVSYFVGIYVYDHNLLPIDVNVELPFKYSYILLVVIIMSIIGAKMFLFSVVFFKDFSKKHKRFNYLLPLILFLFIMLRRYFPISVGSGSFILDNDLLDVSLWILLIVLVIRTVTTGVCNSSLTSGGLTLPMLAMGVLIGKIVTHFFGLFIPDALNYSSIFEVCGMAIVFAIVCNAPLTALLLGLKVSSVSTFILPLGISILLAFTAIKIFKQESVYRLLEKRLPGYSDEGEKI